MSQRYGVCEKILNSLPIILIFCSLFISQTCILDFEWHSQFVDSKHFLSSDRRCQDCPVMNFGVNKRGRGKGIPTNLYYFRFVFIILTEQYLSRTSEFDFSWHLFKILFVFVSLVVGVSLMPVLSSLETRLQST